MSHRLFNAARELAGLSSSEKFVLLMLCDRADEDGRCWPGNPVLCRETCLCDRAVRGALYALREKGFIEVENRSGCSNSYLINTSNWPSTPAPAATLAESATLALNATTPAHAATTPAHAATPHYGEPPVNHQEPYTSVTPENGVPDLFGSKPLETVVQRNGKIPDCPHLKILQAFHEELPQLTQPKPALWNGSRSKLLQDRWKWVLTTKRSSGEKAGQCYASTEAEGVEFFRGFFAYVGRNAFLMGDNDKNWTVDLGWLLKAGNFAKVMEGNYEEKKR